ncbi:MAG: shikimate kinase [Ruminococcaceae bacterium]|nr:shikimate kinase [Oscillospiraceae bacterium]
MKCGLIGERLSHSYSPEIHKELAGDIYTYGLYPIPPESLGKFVSSRQLDAMNVTIPYKKAIIPYLDDVSERALRIGAVNTVFTDAQGRLHGDNTDYYGFMKAVERLGVDVRGKKSLVLGSGGASLTAQAVLSDLGAHVVVISRNSEDNYSNVYTKHADAELIINCTPVGMYPNNGVSPVELERFSAVRGVMDMIYNPSKTKLIYDAEKFNIPALNGLYMLVAQAAAASEIFLGGVRKFTDADIERIERKIRRSSENIILVGMPGSGKTTVGEMLSKRLSREFIDTDEMIVRRAGMDIPTIFEKYGEEEFRLIEEAACADVGKMSGKIISTGGGAVTRPANRYSLRQNSIVVFIERELSLLPTSGRPLSEKSRLTEMLDTRFPLYLDFSDVRVKNDSAPEDTADKILQILDDAYSSEV